MSGHEACYIGLVALVLVVANPIGAEMVFPKDEWQEATPESQGVDSRKLMKAIRYLREHSGSDGVKALVIVRNGYVIYRGEWSERMYRVWSITKAFTSTAQGLLIDDGKCTLDTLAKDFNPYLVKHYPNVTLRHFATMTSGFDGIGGRYDPDAHGRRDRNALVKPLPPVFAPGTKFMYWDEAMMQYGYTLTQIAGESLYTYLKRRILDPIGIKHFKWHRDETGKALNWTGGIEITASDLARFGLLYLNRGNWNGRQLISEWWVREATRVQVPATIPHANPKSTRHGSGVYGYHWFANGIKPDGERKWANAPISTFARSGYNNNDLFVIPAWNMVIVRLGKDQREHEITDGEYNMFLKLIGDAILDPVVDGEFRVWHPVTLTVRGPMASETDESPNPFLDYRLLVTFIGPSGQRYDVHGFFDGDGHGGGRGNVWCARFTPDEAGVWRYKISFRKGDRVAISLDTNAGVPIPPDGATGIFKVDARDPNADGFLKWGRLEYVGKHYLKFRDGPYWLKGGTDSPENFLAYYGFDNTPPHHRFKSHVVDWRPGDPDWGAGKGKGIIGALNYLASQGVNSIYFLTMNIGGDGKDVWPWVGRPNPNGSPDNDNLHYDISKLRQWETVFAHAQRCGIFLHFVLNEAEVANKRELDGGELGVERKLYYREIVARFAHHLALQWNLCEEYNLGFNLGAERIRNFARYIRAIDPYDHPITVHCAGDPLKELRFTFGDTLFSITSIQLGQRRIDVLTEAFRKATAEAGRPLPICMDEFTVDAGQGKPFVPVDEPDLHRKQKLWATYFSGGMVEVILAERLKTDNFKKPDLVMLWRYMRNARRFMEEHLPFWEMAPADELVHGAGSISVGMGGGRTFQLSAQVFAKRGKVYAIYLPKASPTGALDLSNASGTFEMRWYNPRTGEFEGPRRRVKGGRVLQLGAPPKDPNEDWVVLLKLRS